MSKKIYHSDLDELTEELKFESLLHRKVTGKTNSQITSMRKYYRDKYKKDGKIPKSLYSFDGRKYSGRKSTLPKIIENEFINMVRKSASANVNSLGFITKDLRTIVNFHRKLEDKFGIIPIDSLYRSVHKHELKKYLNKPDYEDEADKIIDCFNNIEVFDKIQIDGCEFDYLEIKDQKGEWKRPVAIEFMDTGSRFMFAMEVYFSESNESTVDIFLKFLKSTAFPHKRIQIRPDNANGFLNLKRPIRELNRKYSLPEKFYFSDDFAKVRKPKNKAHLESSHRRLHGFEDYIMEKLPMEKLIERIPGVKINKKSGARKIVTISRYDITIEELRTSGLVERYKKEHNERYRTFSVYGKQKKWEPKEKLESYLSNIETFKFNESHIENCLKYGYQKKPATVAANGRIRFDKCDYQVIEGNFYGGTTRVKVKVSKYENKLFIFETFKDGIYLGEAMLISDTKKPKRTKKLEEKILKKNNLEKLIIYLERRGMTIKNKELERLIELYKQGLNVYIAQQIIDENKETYDKYLKNEKYKSLNVGMLLSNLFFTHYTEYKKRSEK